MNVVELIRIECRFQFNGLFDYLWNSKRLLKGYYNSIQRAQMFHLWGNIATILYPGVCAREHLICKRESYRHTKFHMVVEYGLTISILSQVHFDGLVQDCNYSSALAMELLQYCTKPPIPCSVLHWSHMLYTRADWRQVCYLRPVTHTKCPGRTIYKDSNL